MTNSILFIIQKIKTMPKIALILGSGLGGYADIIDNRTVIPYKDIPNFPISTVVGHKGQLVFGTVNNINVVCMQGRIHYYETGNINHVIYPINLFADMGIEYLITTNAAGGINESFNICDFMIIEDHICINNLNFPLLQSITSGTNTTLSNIYDEYLMEIAAKAAAHLGIKIKKGVMGYCPGPSYETPAEIKMLKIFGADNVGMSTIPEAIMAKNLNMRVLSISAITNIAAGLRDNKLSHTEVLKACDEMKGDFKLLIDHILYLISDNF